MGPAFARAHNLHSRVAFLPFAFPVAHPSRVVNPSRAGLRPPADGRHSQGLPVQFVKGCRAGLSHCRSEAGRRIFCRSALSRRSCCPRSPDLLPPPPLVPAVPPPVPLLPPALPARPPSLPGSRVGLARMRGGLMLRSRKGTASSSASAAPAANRGGGRSQGAGTGRGCEPATLPLKQANPTPGLPCPLTSISCKLPLVVLLRPLPLRRQPTVPVQGGGAAVARLRQGAA